MGIYHLHLQNISRGSGRSATGAAAYRAGEKLRLVEKAAYRAGEDLRDQDTQITHDYTKKSGVVHKEIILPEGTPKKFEDRETLWNAVDATEKRKDARLAKEINIALPTEFDLEEQIEVLHKYIKDNFTEKDVIVDLNIHNTGNGNPHAHIMFPTRHITPEGFGKKNTYLDSKTNLLIWRESWANINNRKFEEKGLAERIDHRTLEAQGIDREPTIHMGHTAWALEKKGVQTERGNINRDIKRRNDERAAKAETERKDDPQDNNATPKNKLPALRKWGGSAERDILMSVKHSMRELEQHLKDEKAAQIAEKLQQQRAAREEAQKITKHLNELEKNYITTDNEINALTDVRDEANYHLPSLNYRLENIDEHTQNTETVQNRHTTLRQQRKKAHFWEIRLKRDLDRKIEQVEDKLLDARAHFKVRYGIEPEQAPQEIKRIEEKIKTYTDKLKKAAQIPELSKKLKDIEKEYHKQKILIQTHPDKELIEKLLSRPKPPPETVRERLQYERINQRLNTITEHNIEDIIRDCERQNTQMVRDLMSRYREEQQRIREKERERERIRERNRNRTIEQSR
ncbi:MAG: MobA/MobL family protein [Nitrososphaerota archaeon]|jgi:hypothetical protein|nr:MobA/MobL family protein [Nitrososphaerota archaeon]